MIWVVLLIIALVAYFIFQGLHARHISRCHTDNRTAEHVPDSAGVTRSQAEFHQQSAATVAQSQRQRLRGSHESPSLLYADRQNTARSQTANHNQYSSQNQQTQHGATRRQSAAQTGQTQCTVDDVLDMELETDRTADHTLEFTAEHEPMGDVGTPTNNHKYADTNTEQQSTSTGVAAAGVAAAAGAAATGAAAASMRSSTAESNFAESDFEDQSTATHASAERAAENPPAQGSGTSENIDLELGESDNTYNDAEDIEGNNHDELLDFGDLTSDISDMLKELNLRETDSPRLEINKDEFKQLKTGEPGDVKPAKIENVADKLRNMLQ